MAVDSILKWLTELGLAKYAETFVANEITLDDLPDLLLLALLPASPAARARELERDLVQGGVVRGAVEPGTEVRFLDRRVRVSQDGRFSRTAVSSVRVCGNHPASRPRQVAPG